MSITYTKAFDGIKPIIEFTENDGIQSGLHRDRTGDSPEWKITKLPENRVDLVPLEGDMKKIVIEDLAGYYGNDSVKFTEKVKEFFPEFYLS